MNFVPGLFLIILVFFLCAAKETTGNLVPNPDFESGLCPDGISEIHFAKFWSSANEGTPDYFKKCSSSEMVGIPRNNGGFQMPSDSDGYAGLFFVQNPDHREYIQCKLLQKLKPGKAYIVSAKINLSDRSLYYLEHFDIALTKTNIRGKSWKVIKCDTNSVIRFSGDTTFRNKTDWISLHKKIIAKGGEQYITLGWFSGEEKLISLAGVDHKKGELQEAYYYIDEVGVTEE